MVRPAALPPRVCTLLLCVVPLSCRDDVGEAPDGSDTADTDCVITCGATTDATADETGSITAPRIATFTASPSIVPAGLPTEVTWEWTFSNPPPSPDTTCIIDGVGLIPSGTTTSITIDVDTVYALECTNAAGTEYSELTVTVGASILDPDRLPPPGTWEVAGVEGGIPERSTICADVTAAPYSADASGATSAVAAIQSAIDDCPDDQVVYVPEGTYLIDAAVYIRTPITLRGAGSGSEFVVQTGTAIHIGGLGPWPPPKANPSYSMPITGKAARASTTVDVADTSSIEVGKMIMVDEEDDPELVWTKGDVPGRYRASMHMVEATTPTSVTFRPALPIDFTRSPQLSWFPDLTHDAGVEGIEFLGTGAGPGLFIDIMSAWNCWVKDCEFSNMPEKTILVAWSAHIELRRIFMHDQANGGPNSEGLDLLADVNWSLVVDNICVAAGFPQINIGDGGANPYYSGGFGNVIAYNYCVDAYYTDPPTSPDAGKMPADIGTNHSPHSQYNLVEGNVVGKFGSDAYHGSGSHTLLLRNVATGASSWTGVSNGTAVQIDRRNLYYSLVGNVFGQAGAPATFEYASDSGWSGNAIYRLGFPDVGNDGYDGTFPPMELLHADGGPRDLYVDRNDTAVGTTLIEGNWNATLDQQDWTVDPRPIPDSYFLTAKPAWFGSLAWPPVDPAAPVTDDPTIIPAGYRYVNGADPPP
jgi:Pectate lyase superfamily protein